MIPDRTGALVALVMAAVLAAPRAVQAEDSRPGLAGPFTLTKPAGAGPFPAVVILHDCSGLGPRSSGAPWRWSTELTKLGYVTIWPDSFSSRDFPDGVCTESDRRRRVGPRIRAADAYAALRFLQATDYVDPKRIAVMGGSHGGSTTLASIVASDARGAGAGPDFAAAIALYPSCSASYGDRGNERARDGAAASAQPGGTFQPLAPTMILTGELDDWTPAAPCRDLAAASASAGFPVEITVYPGAHHAFDSPRPERFDANRNNANAPGRRGATTGGNAEAWADAKVKVRTFLARHLAPAAVK